MSNRIAINDLQPNTDYAVQLRAVGPDGVSEWSRRFLFTTISDEVLPDFPTGVTWVASGDTFHGEWNAVTTNEQGDTIPVTRYEIELVANSITKIVSVAPATGSTKNVFDLTFEANRALFTTPQPTVTFRVRAVDNKELKSNWTGLLSATNAVPAAPTAPAVGSIATAGVESITLAWTPPADLDIVAYNVYVGSTAGFTASAANRIYSGLGTRFVYTTTTTTTQYFKIRAVDKFGQESTDLTANAAATSAFGSDTTPPATPTALDATITNNANGIGASAAVTWTMSSPPADLAGFYVRYRKVGDTNYSNVTFQKDDRAGTIALPLAYTNYEFQIKAFDWSNNESAWSSTDTATSPSNSNPTAVSGFASTPGSDAIRYDWTANTDADLKWYEVQFSTDNTFSTGVTTFKPSGNTMVVSGLANSTTYYARIRSVDTQGAVSAWSSTDTETTLSGAANVSVSDLSGGTITGIDIVLGAGGNMIVNGGHIRSNTYDYPSQSGSIYVYDEAATSGWYIGNDGLVIVDGAVSVGALKSGTIAAETITLGAGGSIVAGSWELNDSGLDIPDGAITAAKVKIQSGQNIVPPIYSDFEGDRSQYDTFTGPNPMVYFAQGAGILDQNDNGYFNEHCLGSLFNVNTVNPIFYLAPDDTTYNIPVSENTEYIFSSYVWATGLVPTNAQMKVKWSNGSIATLTASTGHATTANLSASMSPDDAVRLAGYATVPTGVNGAVVFFESSTQTLDAGFRVDGVQVEEKTSFDNEPSAWSPGSATLISGGQIETGVIRSTKKAIDGWGNELEDPAWQIDLEGDASFGSVWVRGNMTVGHGTLAAPEDTVSVIQSINYNPGLLGWTIRSDGYAEFRQLAADSVDGGAIRAGTLSVDILGGGTLENGIVLNSSITAFGDMGEEVALGEFGFHVLGPHQAAVNNKALTSNVATLTTTSVHGLAVGSRIIIEDVGAPFDGEFEVASVPTSTTFTYALVNADISSTAVAGLVKGKNTLGGVVGPTYVEFPTDGARPNIISGILSAETLAVTNGATIRGISEIERGSVLRLESSITPPAAPALTAVWTTYQSPSPSYVQYTPSGLTKGYNDEWIAISNNSTASQIGRRAFNGAYTGSKTFSDRAFMGIVYNPTHELYYVLERTYHRIFGSDTEWNAVKVVTLDTSFNIVAVSSPSIWTSPTVSLSGAAVPDPHPAGTIGWDFVNNRIVFGYFESGALRHRSMSIDGSGYPDSVVASGAFTGTANAWNPGFIALGSFDLGTSRWIYKDRSTVTSSGVVRSHYCSFTTAGALVANEHWPVAENSWVAGAYWDTDELCFFDLDSNGNIRRYEDGDSYWTSSGQANRWVGITLYDPVGTTHETTLSSVTKIVLPKRSQISVTTPEIELPTDANSPTSMRIYVANTSVEPASTSTDFKLRGTIVRPQTQFIVDPHFIDTPTPPATNGFLSLGATPATIVGDNGLLVEATGWMESANPIVKMTGNGNTNANSGTNTAVSLQQLGTSRGDISVVGSSVVVNRAGWYNFTGRVKFNGGAGNRRALYIEKYTTEGVGAGTAVAHTETGADAFPVLVATDSYYCNAGDNIRMYIWHNAGALLGTFGTEAYLTVMKIV